MLDKAADAMTRAYVLCGWLGGLRLNEALRLEWEQNDKAPWVDFEQDRVWLPAALQVLQKLMRHANIKTTMDFYANVDEAVMEAVLGPQRNTSRNTTAETPSQVGNSSDVTR